MSFLAVALVLAAQNAGAAPARRAITETDLFRSAWFDKYLQGKPAPYEVTP